jgi:L-cysteine desulfidase
MGINYYGITEVEGFVGKTAEQTIQNLSRISTVGMVHVDNTIVDIMQDKTK